MLELVETGVRRGVHAGNELELRFTEVGRDVWMRERGAQRRRVRRHGERAVRPDTQAFLFDSASKPREHARRERAQSCLKIIHCVPSTLPPTAGRAIDVTDRTHAGRWS